MYSNPEEFMLYLKSMYANPYHSVPLDEEFHRLTMKDLDKYKLSKDERERGLDTVLNMLYDRVVAQSNDQEAKKIKSSIAFGVVETGEVNAFIAKGGENIYGVVVNSGLMLFLHKALKIFIGSADPRGIVYCDRNNVGDPDSFRVLLEELCQTYMDTGIPLGPKLKLNDYWLAVESNALFAEEAFVFCHEIGHFLNGDLEDGSNFVTLGENIALKYLEGKNHEKEYNADVKGYEIMCKFVDSRSSNHLRMAPIVMVMDMLAAIDVKETHTHPSPLNRVINIAERCYGPKAAQFWRESYSKLGLGRSSTNQLLTEAA